MNHDPLHRVLIAACLFISAMCATDSAATPMYEATFQATSDWSSGFNGQISIHNTGADPIEDWILAFDLDRTITNLWNGVILSHDGTRYTVENAGWNADIAPGQTVSFGFQANPGNPPPPVNYELVLPPPPAPPQFEMDYAIVNAWPGGFEAAVTIRNVGDSDIDGWSLAFDLDRTVTFAWDADLSGGDSGRPVFSALPYNTVIAPGDAVAFGFLAAGESAEPGNPLLNDVSPVPDPTAAAAAPLLALLARRPRRPRRRAA